MPTPERPRSVFRGPEPYGEGDAAVFFGRAEETDELVAAIERDPCVLLYGVSGIGKTSLLRAGVFPQLRRRKYLPIPVRLTYRLTRPSPLEEVRAAIAAAIRMAGVDAAPPDPSRTLWEYFHRTPFWDAENQILLPVLVFDQFEEVYTLGRRTRTIADLAHEFLVEVSDAVNDTIPTVVTQRVKRHAEELAERSRGTGPLPWAVPDVHRTGPSTATEMEALGVPSSKVPIRLVLSMREDYLAEWDGAEVTSSSLRAYRYRLRALNGLQALSVVRGPDPSLISSQAARDIVLRLGSKPKEHASRDLRDQTAPRALDVELDFYLAKRGGRGAAVHLREMFPGTLTDEDAVFLESLVDAEVEPFLLSLLCRHLEESRTQPARPGDSGDAPVQARPVREVLREFYETALTHTAEHRGPIEEFIQNELLTPQGHRTSAAEEWIRRYMDLEEGRRLLGILVQHRLLRRSEVLNQPHVEIVHDRVAEVIHELRAMRRKPEPVRLSASLRLVILLLAGGILGLLSLWWREHRRAEDLQGAVARDAARAARVASFELAGQSATALALSPATALDLAIRACGEAPTPAALSALHAALAQLAERRVLLAGPGAPIRALGATATGTVICARGDLSVWVVPPSPGTVPRSVANPDRIDFSDIAVCDVGTSFVALLRETEGRAYYLLRSEATALERVAPSPRPTCVALLPTRGEPRLLVGSADGAIRVLDEGQREVDRWGGSGEVTSITATADGRRIAVADDARRVRVLDASTGRPILERDLDLEVSDMLFQPVGGALCVVPRTGPCAWVDVEAPERSRRMSGDLGRQVRRVRFSPDGARVLLLDDLGALRVEDARGALETVVRENLAGVQDAAFAGDGSVLTASRDGLAQAWSAAGEVLQVFAGHSKSVCCICPMPDGRILWTGSDDGTVRAWDLRARGEDGVLRGHSGTVTAARFVGDRDEIVTISTDRTLRWWAGSGDDATGTPSQSTAALLTLAQGRGGTPALVGAASGDVLRLPHAGAEYVIEARLPHPVAFLAEARGRMAAVTNRGGVFLWPLGSPAEAITLPPDEMAACIAWSPDGSRLAVGLRSGVVCVGEPGARTQWTEVARHRDAIHSVCFSREGSRVLAASEDGTACIWDAQGTGRIMILPHRGPVRRAVYAPDDLQVATASGSEVHLWTHDGASICVLAGHTGRVTDIAYSRDGKRLLSASEDATVRRWLVDPINLIPVAEGRTVRAPAGR